MMEEDLSLFMVSALSKITIALKQDTVEEIHALRLGNSVEFTPAVFLYLGIAK